ncbi:MAG: hypothetical protein EOM19_02775 [Candidatus Moranbacteria bacterium]|nr:hypothetical protein [Candidatus Moranbacteria bacterium]
MSEEKEKKTSSHDEWKEMALLYAGKIIQEITGGLSEKIRLAMERVVFGFIRRVIILGIVFLGSVLMILGLVYFLNESMGSSWIGYCIVGGMLLVMGLFISLVSKYTK